MKYTVCLSVFDFTLKPLFEAVDMSKFKDGRVHFRDERVQDSLEVQNLSIKSNVPGCKDGQVLSGLAQFAYGLKASFPH